MKNEGGRPKKTLKDLPKDWEKEAIKLYSEGASDIEVRVKILSISNNLWGRLLKDEPDFWETITRGRELAKVWWMEKGRKGVDSREVNPKMFELNMMNRYGWGKNVKSENNTKLELPNFKWSD